MINKFLSQLLPADWKQALRWMRDQWIAGNKVIWPDWVSVK